MPPLAASLALTGHRNLPKAAATYTAAVLHALAREEHRGRRRPRLLEPGRLTWTRFRGHLGPRDLVTLLLEDAAVIQWEPFDAQRVAPADAQPELLAPELIQSWLDALPTLDLAADSETYLTEQARLLGLPTRLGRSSLHQLPKGAKVLELPGSGGQLAFHIAATQPGVYLQTGFTIGYDGWRERVLAGLVAVEAGLEKDALPLVALPNVESLRALRAEGRGFDHVIGLDPDKGGLFSKSTINETVLPDGTANLV